MGWALTNASTSNVAPIGAVLSHRALSITASVNDEVGCIISSGLEVVV